MSCEVRVRLSEDGADAERLASLARLLRGELLQLDVENVTALRTDNAPAGTRGLDVVAVGGLLVSLGSHAESLWSLVSAVRNWLQRANSTHRSVRLEIGGDSLEVSGASAADQERLIDLFIQRHTGLAGS